jgi:hypothetical protein
MTPDEIARLIGLKIPDNFSSSGIPDEFRVAIDTMLAVYSDTGTAMQSDLGLTSGESLVCMTTALGVACGFIFSLAKLSAEEGERQIEQMAELLRINALAHYRISSLASVPAAGRA